MFLLSVTIIILFISLSLCNPSIWLKNRSQLWNCDLVVIASEGRAGVHPWPSVRPRTLICCPASVLASDWSSHPSLYLSHDLRPHKTWPSLAQSNLAILAHNYTINCQVKSKTYLSSNDPHLDLDRSLTNIPARKMKWSSHGWPLSLQFPVARTWLWPRGDPGDGLAVTRWTSPPSVTALHHQRGFWGRSNSKYPNKVFRWANQSPGPPPWLPRRLAPRRGHSNPVSSLPVALLNLTKATMTKIKETWQHPASAKTYRTALHICDPPRLVTLVMVT